MVMMTVMICNGLLMRLTESFLPSDRENDDGVKEEREVDDGGEDGEDEYDYDDDDNNGNDVRGSQKLSRCE